MESSGNLVRLRRTCWLNRFVGGFIQLGQINVDHDLVPANQVDSPLDELDGDARQALIQALPGRHYAESSKGTRRNKGLWLATGGHIYASLLSP
jgi:hypothetical protein